MREDLHDCEPVKMRKVKFLLFYVFISEAGRRQILFTESLT